MSREVSSVRACGIQKAELLLLFLLLALPLAAQDVAPRAQQFPEVKHKSTVPLRDMSVLPPSASTPEPEENASAHTREREVRALSVRNRTSTTTIQSAPVVQKSAMARLNVTTGLNFEGVDSDGTRSTSDANGAVGSTQYVQWVNTSYGVFDKTSGSLIAGPFYGNTLWKGFGGPCENDEDGDILAQYDKLANVWVMSQHAYSSGSGPFYFCVAVSRTSDATGSWNLYSFLLGNNFPDYPKLAVWPDGYYLSINQQSALTFQNIGALICALDRSSMIAGTTANPMQCFTLSTDESLLPSDLDGTVLPPAGSPNYFVNLAANSLNLWKFHVDWTTPANTSLSGPTAIPVSSFTKTCGGSTNCVPQSGTTQVLDGVGDRLMYRLAYRHFADGHESLVASHSVSTPSGIRWYEIQSPASSPHVVQQSTFAPDTNYRWMPSIAMDRMGDIAVGYSVSSSTMMPAIRYTGRLQSDPLNTMQAENTVIQGSAVQTGSNRWGDYSSMSVDPTDDCTFFYTNQYQSVVGSFNWKTRIASFKFPSCTSNPPVTISPNTLFFGNYNVAVTSPTQTATLKNNQSATLNISSITASGDFTQNNTCGNSVSAGGTCTFTVSFTPSASGIRTGQIVVDDDATGSPQQVINLTGTGGGPVIVFSQGNLAMQALVHATVSKSVTMKNTGTVAATLTSIVPSGDYTLGGTCPNLPSLAPSAACSIVVNFTPSVTGAIAGAVTVNDNAPGAPHLITIGGTGLATLTATPVNLSLGTVAVGSSSSAQNVTISNNASTAQTFSYIASGNFGVVPGGATPCGASPATLNAASKCTISVTFTPTANGSVKGTVAITDTASGLAYNPQLVNLIGTATGAASSPLAFQPTSLSFGSVIVASTTAFKNVSVKNVSTKPLTINSISMSGDFAQGTTGTTLCQSGTVLNVAGTCSIPVSFTPSVQGTLSGSITIHDNSSTGPTIQVFDMGGTGVWPVSLSPISQSFAAQAVGTTSAAKIVTIKNFSSSTVTLNSISASGQYSIVTAGASPCGATVPAAVGQTPGSCTFGVTFTPATSGTIKGVATVSHNAAGSNSPQVVSLAGIGQ
jgi:hypothetical protein